MKDKRVKTLERNAMSTRCRKYDLYTVHVFLYTVHVYLLCNVGWPPPPPMRVVVKGYPPAVWGRFVIVVYIQYI